MAEPKKDLKAGDVVQLKSGGPKMTIRGHGTKNSNSWTCEWFLENGTVSAHEFAPEELEPAIS